MRIAIDVWRAAVVTAVVGAAALAAAAEGPFAIRATEGPDAHLDILQDGRAAVRYMCAFDTSTAERRTATNKPYLHVLDAAGASPITNGAGAKQYPHHRGIFIGWTKVMFDGKAYGLWGMGGTTCQRHTKFLGQALGPETAEVASLVLWDTAPEKTILEEERTFTLHKTALPTLALVEMTSRLTAVAGDLVLDGDPEHAGVHYRPHDDVDRAATKYLFHADGVTPGRGKDTDMPWVAEQYTLGGKTYSVQQMNHPDNPKGSEWSAYRDYGRFGVWFRKDLKKGETLLIRYRFWVLEGQLPTREALQARWEAFARTPPPRSYR